VCLVVCCIMSTVCGDVVAFAIEEMLYVNQVNKNKIFFEKVCVRVKIPGASRDKDAAVLKATDNTSDTHTLTSPTHTPKTYNTHTKESTRAMYGCVCVCVSFSLSGSERRRCGSNVCVRGCDRVFACSHREAKMGHACLNKAKI
jgi:hypothetical protein